MKKKFLVARVFFATKAGYTVYQIKAKRLNYLIQDFISSNFKRRLSFLLSNSEGIEFTAEAPALSCC